MLKPEDTTSRGLCVRVCRGCSLHTDPQERAKTTADHQEQLFPNKALSLAVSLSLREGTQCGRTRTPSPSEY